MKKIIMMLMALCLIAPAATAQQAALTPKQEKMCNKNAKDRAKQFKKDGYEVMGSLPMQDALYKHFAKLEMGATEELGTGHSKSQNNGRQMCITYAMSEYASKAVSQVKGRSVTDAYGNEVDTDNDPEFARFYAAYERLTQKEIKGELQESLTLMKKNPDGSYDFRMYFTVDENKALARRQKALKDAAAESGLAQEYAKQVSEFVNEPLK
ncbi:MAG: hypothetical protein K2L11_08560 [Muribaculaceae bacterium]|nr:hypothetical protein [Muribaculaceae bacterium]